LIDYEFSYDPKPSESLEILQDKLTAFKECELLPKYLTLILDLIIFLKDCSSISEV
jgi:hypothetical protein